MMNDIFRDMLDKGWIVIYMDDILIFSADPEEHRLRTLRVLNRLREHDLYLKAEKCRFDVQEVEFPGPDRETGSINHGSDKTRRH